MKKRERSNEQENIPRREENRGDQAAPLQERIQLPFFLISSSLLIAHALRLVKTFFPLIFSCSFVALFIFSPRKQKSIFIMAMYLETGAYIER